MRFIKRDFQLFLVLLLIGSACGTLRSSRLDEELRAHGIYTCEATPVALAPRAEPRSTHVRCYRDIVELRAPKVRWVRSFYSSIECTGTAIGSAEWSSTIQEPEKSKLDELRPTDDTNRVELRYSEVSGRRLTRKSPDWFLDLRTGCDLKRLEHETPAEIGYDNACAALFPKREAEQSRIIAFKNSNPKEPAKVVHGYWENKTQNCSR